MGNWTINLNIFFIHSLIVFNYYWILIRRHIVTVKHSNILATPLSSYRLLSSNGPIWSSARLAETRLSTKEWETGHWTSVLSLKLHWLHSCRIVLVWIRVSECIHSSKSTHLSASKIKITNDPTLIHVFVSHSQICLVVASYSIHVIHLHLWWNSSFLLAPQPRWLVGEGNILLDSYIKFNSRNRNKNKHKKIIKKK